VDHQVVGEVGADHQVIGEEAVKVVLLNVLVNLGESRSRTQARDDYEGFMYIVNDLSLSGTSPCLIWIAIHLYSKRKRQEGPAGQASFGPY